MKKRDYGHTEVWQECVDVLGDGGLLLVSTDTDGKPNVMTIGWALLGIVWSKPIMTVLVRPSRFTYGLMEAANDFTVNVPGPDLADVVKEVGTRSGRDYDKFAEHNLVATPSRSVASPIIEECLLHYECKVVHKNDVVPPTLTPDIAANAYPQGDYHRIYYGEVVAVYGVDNLRERLDQR